MSRTRVAVLALLFLVGADAAKPSEFQVASVKAAQGDHDKLIAKAADAYRLAVLNADKSYETRLSQLQKSEAVQKCVGESDRIDKEVSRVKDEIGECGDGRTTIQLVKFEPVVLHKGMAKQDLLSIFRGRPASDETDADGLETIVWEKKALSAPSIGAMGQGARIEAVVVETTTVTLQNGIVTDYRVEK